MLMHYPCTTCVIVYLYANETNRRFVKRGYQDIHIMSKEKYGLGDAN